MMKKRPYSTPALTKLTKEQAIELIADRKNCSEKEAAEFLESLHEKQQNDAADKDA